MAKKYYWLKLKEDFFDDDAIGWLEEQPKGKEYALFYLKLCLKSLKTDGILVRNVGTMLVPYDMKKLSEITKTEVDTVIVAMELLKNIGLVEILEDGKIFLPGLRQMVGSESQWAKYKKRMGNWKISNRIPIKFQKNSNRIPMIADWKISNRIPTVFQKNSKQRIEIKR